MKNSIRKALSNSGENYLEAVLMIQEKKGVAYSVDLAHKLGVSKPSVSVAVHALENEGYLIIGDDKALRLTDAGKAIAEEVYEKHHFFTKALIRLGVDPRIAEDDACRIEHVVSEGTFSILKAYARRCTGEV